MAVKDLLTKQRWFLATRPRLDSRSSYAVADGYRLIEPPRDRFYADPCLIQSAGTSFMFFEEYRYTRSIGSIACFELDRAGCAVSQAVVLERPYHLSFPFVFRWAGEFWMVPESSENGTIEIYRAVRFPHEWKLEKLLMGQVRASDSVVFFHEEKVWLMTVMESSQRGVWDSLHLYYSDSLLGEWKPHPMNPVVRDASRARPAGAIFADTGRLIRPGQDCSQRYGGAIQFCRIDTLNEKQYRETPVERLVGAQFAASGTHTYTRDDALEAVDGWRAEIDPRGKLLSVVGAARRLFGL